MYWLFCYKHQKTDEPIKFDSREEAEQYAKLLHHFGQEFWLVNGIYEYNVETGWWDNMAY